MDASVRRIFLVSWKAGLMRNPSLVSLSMALPKQKGIPHRDPLCQGHSLEEVQRHLIPPWLDSILPKLHIHVLVSLEPPKTLGYSVKSDENFISNILGMKVSSRKGFDIFSRWSTKTLRSFGFLVGTTERIEQHSAQCYCWSRGSRKPLGSSNCWGVVRQLPTYENEGLQRRTDLLEIEDPPLIALYRR